MPVSKAVQDAALLITTTEKAALSASLAAAQAQVETLTAARDTLPPPNGIPSPAYSVIDKAVKNASAIIQEMQFQMAQYPDDQPGQ